MNTNTNTNKHYNSINRQFNKIIGLYRNAINKIGVSENEFWIWYSLLVMEGKYSQQDICATWSLSKQTVNTIITNMTKKGLVFLEVVPGTRNRKIIHLTAEGKNYAGNIVLPILNAEQAAFARLTQQEQADCDATLAKYIDFLGKELLLDDDC